MTPDAEGAGMLGVGSDGGAGGDTNYVLHTEVDVFSGVSAQGTVTFNVVLLGADSSKPALPVDGTFFVTVDC